MNILARHLTADFYNCKTSRLQAIERIKDIFPDLLIATKYNVRKISDIEISAEHYASVALCSEGHVTLHIYKHLRYVAADVFLCEESAEPEKLFKTLRKFFQPDQTKTIFLKRGDFGREKDIKPRIKIHIAPLKKIKNTGAKVARVIARKIISG